jgi:hypothetical protein
MGKKTRSRSVMNIPGHISESIETIFWVKLKINLIILCGSGIWNLFDPGSGMEEFGSGINIMDPQH